MAPDPDARTKPELEQEAESLGVETTGKTKAELADAIEEINPPPEDTETPGRPPLDKVARERVTERNVRVIGSQEEG